jgi:hypothetical protein
MSRTLENSTFKLLRPSLAIVLFAALAGHGLACRAADVFDDSVGYIYSYYNFYETRNQLGELIHRMTLDYSRSSHDADAVMTFTEVYPRYWEGEHVWYEYYYADDSPYEPEVERLNKQCDAALSTLRVITTQGLDIHVITPGEVRLWKRWTDVPVCLDYGDTSTTYQVALLSQTGWVQRTYLPFNALIEDFWVNPN